MRLCYPATAAPFAYADTNMDNPDANTNTYIDPCNFPNYIPIIDAQALALAYSDEHTVTYRDADGHTYTIPHGYPYFKPIAYQHLFPKSDADNKPVTDA